MIALSVLCLSRAQQKPRFNVQVISTGEFPAWTAGGGTVTEPVPYLIPHREELNNAYELLVWLSVSDAKSLPRGRILQKQKPALTAALRYVQGAAKLCKYWVPATINGICLIKTHSCSAPSVTQHLAREIYLLIITENWLLKLELLKFKISWFCVFLFSPG